MKRFFLSGSFFLLTLGAISSAHAATAAATVQRPATTEMAAQVMSVKSPAVQLYNKGGNSAEGFMEIENNGVQSHILIAAYTPIDAATVLHRTVTQGNKTVMRRIKHILIPARKSADLAFGGLHIMLTGLKQPLAPNTTVPLTLVFDDGSALTVQAKVVQ